MRGSRGLACDDREWVMWPREGQTARGTVGRDCVQSGRVARLICNDVMTYMYLTRFRLGSGQEIAPEPFPSSRPAVLLCTGRLLTLGGDDAAKALEYIAIGVLKQLSGTLVESNHGL